MDAYNISFWESQSFLKPNDVIIIGGGIVGINSAISLKQSNPGLDVLIIDRNTFPLGASTRNAGFACFGSVTELLDDLERTDEETVFSLVKKRYEGLLMLRKRVGDEFMDYNHVGAYELFDRNNKSSYDLDLKVKYLNDQISRVIGLKSTFQIKHELHFPFSDFDKLNIFNQHEGQLHPGKMMLALYKMASELGVRFLMGVDVTSFDEKNGLVELKTKDFSLNAKKIVVCANGFAKSLIPDLKLSPARNQVVLTEPIKNLTWQGCFHYDKGYVYFRNVGNRLLLGGARNIDFKNEETSKFGFSKKIEAHLMDFMKLKIGIPDNVRIESQWSGIMAVGSQKVPILKKYSEHIILAVRMGGMGVALGSLVGDEAAKLVTNSIT